MALRFNLPVYSRADIVLLSLALLGLLAVPSCYSSSPPATGNRQEASGVNEGKLSPSAEVGHLAPDFTLVDLEGNQVKLSDLRGKTVFLNFWTTWCPACRAEMPEIEAVYQEYKDSDVAIIGIDLYESEDEVLQFVQRGGYSWTFVIDTTGEVSSNYRVTGIPASFFLDREGVVRAVSIGAITKRDMEIRLAAAMR